MRWEFIVENTAAVCRVGEFSKIGALKPINPSSHARRDLRQLEHVLTASLIKSIKFDIVIILRPRQLVGNRVACCISPDMRAILLAIASSAQIICARQAHDTHKSLPGLPLGLWRELNDLDHADASISALSSKYPSHYLQVPVDHFSYNDTSSPVYNQTFGLRYWFDATYYRPGGPVFCLDGGETSGEDRLPFLDHGILQILANATNGLAVVLEHRYYGDSFPVEDLSTDNLRWLTTHQALADNAYFTNHAKFPGLHEGSAEALRSAPWIHYGGR